jgi:shikimate dehydrogenase
VNAGGRGDPALAGVIGFPVAHSRSPAMMNAAFRELGLDWRYVKLPVPPELLEETARALPGSGYRGANVTVPHKLAALALADEATAAARGIGAANTLSFEHGSILADNTDAGGFLDALGEEEVRGARALVLGAGGAGRAAAWALRQAGAGEVSVWNRTPERAAEVAAELGVRVAERAEPADLLVNATTVGLDPAVGEAGALAALGLSRFDPPPVVVDLVYGDRTTPVCGWAERGGGLVVDGIEVLVRQGARGFERWTGRAAPLAVMRAAARGGGSEPA